MESTRAPLAFGERGIPKLNEELTSAMVVTRQKALVTIEDLMHGVEKVHEAVRCGVMKQIIRLLQDSDDTIRYKSVSVLFIMLQHTVGRQAFLKSDGLDKLIKLFSDKSIKIVKIAFTAMKILTEVPHYAREIAIEKAPGLRTQLIKEHLASVGTQLSPDELNIVLSSLDIIHNLLFVEPHPVDYKNEEDQPNDNAENDLRALDAFTRLCLHENSQIKSSVCRSLHDLAANSQAAKETASQNTDLIQTLVNHLSDDDKTVRVTACQALMSICITTKGKLTAVSMGVVEKLISLLDESIACSVPEKLSRVEEFEASLNDSLRLYAVRATEVMSEVPKARDIFSQAENVDKLRSLAENKRLSSDVRRAAEETISVIQWIP